MRSTVLKSTLICLLRLHKLCQSQTDIRLLLFSVSCVLSVSYRLRGGGAPGLTSPRPPRAAAA
ncbi:hypothetical protein PR002_g27891 [Phytophthora rubi]|uniref:Uncharacterized protein n=1 Tax=Phytophthora rubi TaxID=129364 RepID=A0A6A3HDF9_9STRA|nr:hypothetical protein PR002_g27891 [Phytophthora rubi]